MRTSSVRRAAAAAVATRPRQVVLLTAVLMLTGVTVWAAFFRSHTPVDGQVELGVAPDVQWSDTDTGTVTKAAGDGSCAGSIAGTGSDRTLTVDMSGAAPGLVCHFAATMVNPGVDAVFLEQADVGDDPGIVGAIVQATQDGVTFACGDTFTTGGKAVDVTFSIEVTEDVDPGETIALPTEAGVLWETADAHDPASCP